MATPHSQNQSDDRTRFLELMQEHDRAQRDLPDDDQKTHLCVGILEEMHVMIHERRVPKHADKGLCSHRLGQLYVQLRSWDRYFDWMKKRRDLEPGILRQATWTLSMSRFAKRHFADPAVARALLEGVLTLELPTDASSAHRADLCSAKGRACYELWCITDDGEDFRRAIRWADAAYEASGSTGALSPLQRMLRAKGAGLQGLRG